MRLYPKPTSTIDAATGDLVLRISPVAIAALAERWYAENCGKGEHIRITDFDGLVEAVCKNVHAHDEDWFPGDMTAIESWMAGSGCEAVLDDGKLYTVIPAIDVEEPRRVSFGEWAGRYNRDDLISNFDIHRSELIGVEFLVAGYDLTEEFGSAVVVFKRGGKLWRVYGLHVPGKDFSKQWKPVETTIDRLRAELPATPGDDQHRYLIDSLSQALNEMEASQKFSEAMVGL